MNLLYVLISFALVNVLVALDNYTKEVIMANKHIMRAREDMPQVIQNIVCFGNFRMAELALMLAVPEFDIRDDLKDYLVHKKIDYQKIVREKIWCSTKTLAPSIDEDLYKNADLNGLGVERRGMTMEAIKALFSDILSGKNEYFIDYSHMCRLMGVFKTIHLNSKSFIECAVVPTSGVCVLVDNNKKSISYYKFDGKIWEMNPDGTQKELLADQIKFCRQESPSKVCKKITLK
ncbi:uncharacterized protein LOC126832810 [Adelges cooleyi]|uniref:uncharacterized protein LOC126832810 n=1 Tax=Adelges cooleyi TaxID=133065 RepID=UPI00217F90F6|nr:uncharacterized protein LOC126832810 [Adelges cooleyi]